MCANTHIYTCTYLHEIKTSLKKFNEYSIGTKYTYGKVLFKLVLSFNNETSCSTLRTMLLNINKSQKVYFVSGGKMAPSVNLSSATSFLKFWLRKNSKQRLKL